jgi:hypothetical protein
MPLRSRPRRIALLIGLVAAFVAVEARAAETGNGSKNFSVPASVPNYFSNEAGPLQGPASETQRGQLYGAAAAPQAARVAAEAPRARQHVAMAEPRGRLIHGRAAYDRRGRTMASNHAVAHGRPISHAAAHAVARGHAERVAAHAHSVVRRPTQVSSARHHARG